MPPRRPPADPGKRNPTGVRKAGAKKKWVLRGTVGNFEPERVRSKPDTTALTKQEKAAGATKLDRDVRFDWEKGTLERPGDGPLQPGGGRRVDRP